MSNLQKFNITLEEFDNEVGKLKDVASAYQKLEGLIRSYEKISSQFQENSQELSTISALQKDQREEIFTLIRTVEKQFLSEQGQFSKYMELEFSKYRNQLSQDIEKQRKIQTQEILDGQKKIQSSIWAVVGLLVGILILLFIKL